MVQFYARLNTCVSVCTVLVQTIGAGKLMRHQPLLSLLVSPAIGVAGFFTLWRWDTLGSLSLFWVVFKCGHYAIEKPAKELPRAPTQRSPVLTRIAPHLGRSCSSRSCRQR